MADLLKKTILAGLGAMSLSREKAAEITKDLISRGELAKSEEAEFIKSLMDLVEKNKVKLEDKIGKSVEGVLSKLDIPTRKEFEALKEEISRLNRKES